MHPSTIILLLTRQCLFSCTHCNTLSGPRQTHTFSHMVLVRALHYLSRVRTITDVIFSGGEPFLHYPLLKHGVFEASTLGLRPSVWTSGYFFRTRDDVVHALRPLIEVGLKGCLLSADEFHENADLARNVEIFRSALADIGCDLHLSSFSMKETAAPPTLARSGDLPLGGPVPFMGRAARNIPGNMALWDPEDLDLCPHLDLASPTYLYLDSHGNLHLCPGIVLHNIFRGHVRRFFKEFVPHAHPIMGPLSQGGPRALARALEIPVDPGYADQCHLCWEVRSKASALGHPALPQHWYQM